MGSSHGADASLSDFDSDTELARVSKRHKPDPSLLLPHNQDSDDLDLPPGTNDTIHKQDSTKTTTSDNEQGQGATPEFPRISLLSLSSPSIDSSDLDEIAELPTTLADDDTELAQAMKHNIYETRQFLKRYGIMAFLQEYLPPTALSENIVELIVKLGFFPRNIPPLAQGENLLQLIKLLHVAMKRVRQFRARLDNFYTVDHVLDKLRAAKRILVITGAGISTSLGIPDFRSSKGFYSRIANLGLSDPQEVFDLSIFHADPSIFYSIAYMILPPDDVCLPLHKFIKLLQDKGKLLRNYTQNIDNLEANAGIDYDRMIQCHGSFAFATCVTCGYRVKGETIYENMRNKEIAFCPKCAGARKRLMSRDDEYVEESYGVMKPNITFFGEALPLLFHDNINQDLSKTDLVISIGTSLKVAPVAEIVDKVPEGVPQILINKDPIHHCNFDVSLLGFCDDVASYLCERLGEDWAIDHPDYLGLIGDGTNLVLEDSDEKGVYHVHNLKREREMAAIPPVPMEEPDLVVLEPTLN